MEHKLNLKCLLIPMMELKYYLSNVYDVDVLASMATPGGGRNNISGRILSKFNVI